VLKRTQKLYEYVAQEVLDRIHQGVYRSGERLPGVRRLREQFGVSLSTVLEACRLLEDRRIIEAYPRSGFFVRAGISANPEEPEISEPPSEPISVTGKSLALRLIHAGNNSEFVQLGAAAPDPTFLPVRALSRALGDIARKQCVQVLGNECPPGNSDLRRQISRRMAELGCSVSPEQVVITNGAHGSLTLALRAVLDPGDIVAIESPTFYGLLQAIESTGMRAIEIPTHPKEGMSLEALQLAIEQWPVKACVVVPNFSNPLGFLMSDEKKKALVSLLSHHNIPLIEDDVYGDLHFGFHRPSVAKALDATENILYCSSFSKTLSPGLRTGWIIPGRFQEKVEHLKFVLNLSAPTVSQLAIARLLERGYEGHIRRVRRSYSISVARMTQSIGELFPTGTKVTKPEGGFVLWVEFPKEVDAVLLSQKAYKEGISIVPGDLFSATQKYKHHIRLNCAVPWDDRVEWALRRIGQLASYDAFVG
jgi:DNA-binding transcriptional MocR family regulator